MKTFGAIVHNKIVIIGLFVVASLLVALGIGFLLAKTGVFNAREQKYSMVYLDTGDIYVGQFRAFPFPTLCQGYILQRSQTGTQLISFADTIWSPESCIRLNKEHILFSVEVSNASQIAQMIKQYGAKSSQPSLTPSLTPVPTPSK